MAIDVQDLVAAIGKAATLCLLNAKAGTRIYLTPKGEAVRELLGDEAFEKLLKLAGCETIPGFLQVPLGRNWRMHMLRDQGKTLEEIGLALCMTENGVWRALQKRRPNWMGPAPAAPKKSRQGLSQQTDAA